jgi:hypothetical protein
VLRIVKDQRPRRRRADDPLHVSQTEDGEMVIDSVPADSSADSRPAKAPRHAKPRDIFEDDGEEAPRKKGSMFSDDEDGSGSFDGDDGSSGIGSEDDYGVGELDEESQMHVRTAALREAGWVQTGDKSKAGSKPRTFVRGGYDYGIHLKETGNVRGAVFVNKDGTITAPGEEEENEDFPALPKKGNAQLLPSDLFASKPSKDAAKADAHDKMFGAMEDVDPEIQAMLDSSSSEGEEDEDPSDLLDDDFVLQAIKPVEGEPDEMDVRAYLDNIIRTGKLPGELDDPFGDDALEDIDEFLSHVPQKSGSLSKKPTTGSHKPSKPSASLDDIDDDIDVPRSSSKSKKQSGKPGHRNVRFANDTGSEEDEEDEEDMEYDSDMFEEDDTDEDMDNTERRARQMGREIPGRAPLSAAEAARALHRFETALADYDETMELDGDDPAAHGPHDVNNFTDILDDFIDDAVALGLRPANSKGEVARHRGKEHDPNAAEDESSSTNVRPSKRSKKLKPEDPEAVAKVAIAYGLIAEPTGDTSEEEYDVHFEGREQAQWDVESYLTTYTDTENHPRLVEESTLNRRIQIGRGGVPTGVLQHERKKSAKEVRARQREEEEAYLAHREATKSHVNIGVPRPKNETPEERKARKEALKLEKKVNREVKRQLKDSFTQESVRQQRQQAGHSRATIVHL